MPNSFLPGVRQGGAHSKEGVVLLGDSWNMRHPLTGGGMTVAFNDVVLLRDLLMDVDQLADWKEVSGALRAWHWKRKPLASTVNILSVALYDLFGADGPSLSPLSIAYIAHEAADPLLEVLRTGCFKYFELGGACAREHVSLLSAYVPLLSILNPR